MNDRAIIEDLMIRIGALNDEKSAIIRAWEGEKIRQNEPDLDKPPELIRLNKQLKVWYGMKDDILKRSPHLEKDFGGKRKTLGKSPLGTSPKKKENKEIRKARYLANREARRQENRQRASQRGAGGKKKS